METIERINRNIKEAVAAINSCMPTAMEAAENIRKNLKLLSEVNSMAEPQLIQGYTAEQWQEIIDGGYLCEFGIVGDKILSRIGMLTGRDKSLFVDDREHNWQFCRPAQIKGIMRPIFVEPVDKEAYCHFFSGSGSLLFSGKWEESGSLSQVTEQVKMLNGATKYIEL